MKHKFPKRNINESEKILREAMENHRLNSKQDEIKRENYIRIDNTKLEPEAMAEIIRNKFQF